ncbi:MAG: hypothetical protein EHM46_05290 [Bacteroidetes bacterium]|nr:MAG: hypothetical protein EHM46_05290 [Bacteroidota bacterium]
MISYRGPITIDTIEDLLNQLRLDEEFQRMAKPARKRLYSTFVETLDNIKKYAASASFPQRKAPRVPVVTVEKHGFEYLITGGNLVLNEDIGELRFKLERVNQLDKESLKSLYEEIINREPGLYDTGAGLGLITIALKTQHEIRYRFEPVDQDHSYFQMQVIING